MSNNEILSVHDAKSGTRVCHQRVGEGCSFVASPVLAAAKPYIASEDGDVYVVKAGAQYELLSKNPIGEPVLATSALAGDLLLVRGAKHLFAVAE